MPADPKKALAPIIVKRIKKPMHAHHGGAWKIAYADFVTAMMAFFLLMWLLGSTSEGDKKGIADFFQSPVRVSLAGGGTGSGDSSHVIQGGGQDLTRTSGMVKRGDTKASRSTLNLQALRAEHRRAEVVRLEALKKKVENTIADNARLAQLDSQIRIEMTPEGLRIEIVDALLRPMFTSGSAVVQPYMRELLQEIGKTLVDVPNRLTLEGHTDSVPFSGGDLGYSNWELSADRANASRRELAAGGLPEERVLRVQGLASSRLLEAQVPKSPANRRISIVVMNGDALERFLHHGADHEAATADEVAEAAGAEGAGAAAGGMQIANDAVR